MTATAAVSTDFRRALLTASFEFSRAIGFRGSWLELPTRDEDVPTFLHEDKHFPEVIIPPKNYIYHFFKISHSRVTGGRTDGEELNDEIRYTAYQVNTKQ